MTNRLIARVDLPKNNWDLFVTEFKSIFIPSFHAVSRMLFTCTCVMRSLCNSELDTFVAMQFIARSIIVFHWKLGNVFKNSDDIILQKKNLHNVGKIKSYKLHPHVFFFKLAIVKSSSSKSTGQLDEFFLFGNLICGIDHGLETFMYKIPFKCFQ